MSRKFLMAELAWAAGIFVLMLPLALLDFTAWFVLISSGIEIGSIGAALLSFSLGATFLACGRMLSRQLRPTS